MTTLVEGWRADFPIFTDSGSNPRLVYLDSAASSQMPAVVIQQLEHYYKYSHANVSRGVYALSTQATAQYEAARAVVQQYINAKHAEEVVFVRGATEAINLVATTYGQHYCQRGDEIILSVMEHHANIVPWQLLANRLGLILRFTCITSAGELDLVRLAQLFNARTKLLAVTHVSNVLGTINPVQKIIAAAHAHKVPVLLDGAQAIAHSLVDVQQLDCDFYVFSGHKTYGPTGIGVLYGKHELLEQLPPYQGGGGMIEQVSLYHSTYQGPPAKFEAGTPNIAGAIGLARALRYLTEVGMDKIMAHEQSLLHYAKARLQALPGVSLLGQPQEQAGIVAFTVAGVHPHDLCTIVDRYGVAVRGGHHCAMPLLQVLGLPAVVRLSLGMYNNCADIDMLITGIVAAQQLLG